MHYRQGLIKSCWNLDHRTRPQASAIVDFLAGSPRLLHPCLDVPLASVQNDISLLSHTIQEEDSLLQRPPIPNVVEECPNIINRCPQVVVEDVDDSSPYTTAVLTPLLPLYI